MDVEGQPRDERPARHRKRLDVAGDARYLTCSCFRNRPFLRSDRTCTWFTEALVTSRRKHGFALWAWVVMPTHFHLLVLPPHDNPVVGPMLST
jgi:REP element-mobilizing transposase RayT